MLYQVWAYWWPGYHTHDHPILHVVQYVLSLQGVFFFFFFFFFITKWPVSYKTAKCCTLGYASYSVSSPLSIAYPMLFDVTRAHHFKFRHTSGWSLEEIILWPWFKLEQVQYSVLIFIVVNIDVGIKSSPLKHISLRRGGTAET